MADVFDKQKAVLTIDKVLLKPNPYKSLHGRQRKANYSI